MNTIVKLALLAFVPPFTVWLTDRPTSSFPVSVVSVSVFVLVVSVSVSVAVVPVVLVSVSSVVIVPGDVVSVSVAGPVGSTVVSVVVVVDVLLVVGGGSVVGSVVGLLDVGTVPSVVFPDELPELPSVSVAPTKSSPHPPLISTPSITTAPH